MARTAWIEHLSGAVTMHPYPEHDGEIRRWFERQGWADACPFDSGDGEEYGWRHRAADTITLRVEREVLEDQAPDELIALLDFWRVAQKLRARPAAFAIVRERGGQPVFEQLDQAPSA